MNAQHRFPERPEPMGLLYWMGWTGFRLLFSTYFRWHYYNPERVPITGPALIASNHESFLDPPLVGSALPRALHFMARDTLFRFKPLGALLRAWNAVPVDREGGGAAGLRRILEVLEAGHAVIMFPEGTRTRDGRLQRARSGVGLAILKSDAPVIPVRVFGTYEAYGRNAKLPRPRPVAVKYGRAMHFEAFRAEAAHCSKARLKEIYQEVADAVMDAIGRLQPYEERDTFP